MLKRPQQDEVCLQVSDSPSETTELHDGEDKEQTTEPGCRKMHQI